MFKIFKALSSPEQINIDSSTILDFIDSLDAKNIDIHSFVLIKDSYIVAEGLYKPYIKDTKHDIFSLSKSFVAIAIGIALEEGCLKLSDKVLDFFPDEVARPSVFLSKMKIKHLLTMSSGFVQQSNIYRKISHNHHDDWVFQTLNSDVIYQPGTRFCYDSMDTYLLSVILQKTTGKSVLEYLSPLFDILDIKGATWENCPRGYNIGAWGLKLSTLDVAKFAQFLLNKGVCNGKQIVSEQWILEATALQVETDHLDEDIDWHQGYGYHFWQCRNGAYRGDGAFGQLMVVMPEQNAAIAIDAGTTQIQDILDSVWRYILPAVTDNSITLSENPIAYGALKNKLDCLEVSVSKSLPVPDFFKNFGTKTYSSSNGEIIRITANESGNCFSVLYFDNIIYKFKLDKYVPLINDNGDSLVCYAYWKSENILGIIMRFMDKPTIISSELIFDGNQIKDKHIVTNSFYDENYVKIWHEKLITI